MAGLERTGSNCGVTPINYGGMKAFRLRLPHKLNLGIQETVVLQNGFNIVSKKGSINGQEQELLRTEPEATIKKFLDEGYNNYFTKGSALLAPWANRIWGKQEGDFLRVSFDGRTRLVPMNFPNEKTSIHGEICDRNYNDTYFFNNETGLVLGGLTHITDKEWFSSLMVGQYIKLFSNGSLSRNILITNTGKYSAPVSVGEHPYYDIPEGQKREDVTLDIPAQLVVRADFNDHLRPMFKHPDLLTKFDGDFFPKESKLTLGDFSFDHCFTGLIRPSVLKIGFPALGWGVSIEGKQSVNAIQVYSPTDPAAAAFNSVAAEMQTNLADPTNNAWRKHSDFGPMGFTGSGMKVLKPGEILIWEVIHSLYPIN
jgi:galactose mutarotase-like enzyme